MKNIIIVAYLMSSMATPAMAIMLYRTTSIVVIKFRISRILIPIVVDLFIIGVVVVMPLMPVMFSCHKVIEMTQHSDKVIVNMSNGCLHYPKLGVGGKLCALQHTNPLICDLYISINSLRVLLYLTYHSLNSTLHARGLWWCVLVIVRLTCHGEVHKTKKKTSEEEQKKGLALLGCSCCKALALNLLTRGLTNSYLPPQNGEGNQQVSNLEDGVSVLARESL
jgi:hypothetical protein